MKFQLVVVLLCGLSVQVLCLPLNSLTKRNYRRLKLVKLPEDVEDLERELKAKKVVVKKQAERQNPTPIQMSIPNSDGPTDHRQPPTPPELANDALQNGPGLMDAVGNFMDYMRENPYVLQAMLQTEQNKGVRDWASSQGPEKPKMMPYPSLNDQLGGQPKMIQKKDGREHNRAAPSRVFIPGMSKMEEGGETEEEAEQQRANQVTDMFHRMQTNLDGPKSMFMHPIPQFDELPNPDAQDINEIASEENADITTEDESENSQENNSQDISENNQEAHNSNSDGSDEGDGSEDSADTVDTHGSNSESMDDIGNNASDELAEEDMRSLLARKLKNMDEDDLSRLILGRLKTKSRR